MKQISDEVAVVLSAIVDGMIEVLVKESRHSDTVNADLGLRWERKNELEKWYRVRKELLGEAGSESGESTPEEVAEPCDVGGAEADS